MILNAGLIYYIGVISALILSIMVTLLIYEKVTLKYLICCILLSFASWLSAGVCICFLIELVITSIPWKEFGDIVIFNIKNK